MAYEPGKPEFNPPFAEVDELGEAKQTLDEVPINFDERGSAAGGHEDHPTIDALDEHDGLFDDVDADKEGVQEKKAA